AVGSGPLPPPPSHKGRGSRDRSGHPMSDTAGQFLLGTRGIQRDLDAFVVAIRFDRSGKMAAFALGDGSVHLAAIADKANWRKIEVHDGAALALAPDAAPAGFVSGGDDGKLRRINADGAVADIANFRSKWVEHVATHAGDKAKGLIACAVGKLIHLFDQSGQKLKELPHPSAVSGLAFDAKGKRIAASHY